MLCQAGSLISQTYAVSIEAPSITEPVNLMVYNEITGALKEKLKLDSWKFNTDENGLSLDNSYRQEGEEKAANFLWTIFFKIHEDYNKELQFTKDTTGKVTGAYFYLKHFNQYKVALTDLKTSEILFYESKFNAALSEMDGISIPVPLATYFGSAGPAAMRVKSPKEYNAALIKAVNDFKPKFEEYYASKRPGFHSILSRALRFTSGEEKPYKIESPWVENGKLKEFQCTMMPDFYKDMYVTVFSLDTIGQYIIPENYKTWIVEEVNGDKGKLDTYFPLPSRNKDAGEAIESGRQLYFVPGDIPYADVMTKEEKVTIDLQGLDLGRGGEVYNFLSKSPKISLINSMDGKLITSLHERYKGGRFIDSGFNVTSLGAQFILSESDDSYILQDATSGTVMGNVPKVYGDKGVFDLLQKTLDLKVIIIQPLNSKKEALKEALVYSPLGFFDNFYFDIMRRTPENINGRTIYREEEIGRGQMYNAGKRGHLFGEAKFTKGDKEIGAAYANKEDILFLNHEFKFLGTPFK